MGGPLRPSASACSFRVAFMPLLTLARVRRQSRLHFSVMPSFIVAYCIAVAVSHNPARGLAPESRVLVPRLVVGRHLLDRHWLRFVCLDGSPGGLADRLRSALFRRAHSASWFVQVPRGRLRFVVRMCDYFPHNYYRWEQFPRQVIFITPNPSPLKKFQEQGPQGMNYWGSRINPEQANAVRWRRSLPAADAEPMRVVGYASA